MNISNNTFIFPILVYSDKTMVAYQDASDYYFTRASSIDLGLYSKKLLVDAAGFSYYLDSATVCKRRGNLLSRIKSIFGHPVYIESNCRQADTLSLAEVLANSERLSKRRGGICIITKSFRHECTQNEAKLIMEKAAKATLHKDYIDSFVCEETIMAIKRTWR